jgi:hypothetical protein
LVQVQAVVEVQTLVQQKVADQVAVAEAPEK